MGRKSQQNMTGLPLKGRVKEAELRKKEAARLRAERDKAAVEYLLSVLAESRRARALEAEEKKWHTPGVEDEQ